MVLRQAWVIFLLFAGCRQFSRLEERHVRVEGRAVAVDSRVLHGVVFPFSENIELEVGSGVSDSHLEERLSVPFAELGARYTDESLRIFFYIEGTSRLDSTVNFSMEFRY